MILGRRPWLLGLAAAGLARHVWAAEPVRVGTLRFGAVAWEVDVIRTHGLAPGVAIETVEFATAQAPQVALQAGLVDVIVQDWLWVAGQRAAGADWTLSPNSGALGAVMVAAASPVRQVGDLVGKRLGVAGSPLDKSWLILRAYAQRSFGINLDATIEKTFGPPPLLSELLEQGRLDAVLNYWPFAAREQAAGLRALVTVEAAVASLGGQGVPFLGYVFSDAWAHDHAEPFGAVLAASAQARQILRTDDAEWVRLMPLTGAKTSAELLQMRDWYRQGQSDVFDPAAAGRLYDVLAELGGDALVGPAAHLTPGTFWVS